MPESIVEIKTAMPKSEFEDICSKYLSNIPKCTFSETDSGFRIKENKIDLINGTYPVTADISYSTNLITIRAKCSGLGPIQKRHVTEFSQGIKNIVIENSNQEHAHIELFDNAAPSIENESNKENISSNTNFNTDNGDSEKINISEHINSPNIEPQNSKIKFYKTNWFLWLFLIIFPPIGIFLLWKYHKEKNSKTKAILSTIFIIWLIIIIVTALILINIPNNKNTNPNNAINTISQNEAAAYANAIRDGDHIYDNVIICPVIDPNTGKEISKYSIAKIDSSNAGFKNLKDWYFNYVNKGEYDKYIIIYNNDDNNLGIYAVPGFIARDCKLILNEYNDYVIDESSLIDASIYNPPTTDNKMFRIAGTDKTNAIKNFLGIDIIIDTETQENNTQENEPSSETNTPEPSTIPESPSVSSDDFIRDVRSKIRNAVGNHERIKDVQLDNKNLYVYVDFSQASAYGLPLEEVAKTSNGSITDSILELNQYDDLWDTITVDFGDLGCIKNNKYNIRDDGYGRYFPSANFRLT